MLLNNQNDSNDCNIKKENDLQNFVAFDKTVQTCFPAKSYYLYIETLRIQMNNTINLQQDDLQ